MCDLKTSRIRRLKPASGLYKPEEEEEEEKMQLIYTTEASLFFTISSGTLMHMPHLGRSLKIPLQ
jgi:hypothetical protein